MEKSASGSFSGRVVTAAAVESDEPEFYSPFKILRRPACWICMDRRIYDPFWLLSSSSTSLLYMMEKSVCHLASDLYSSVCCFLLASAALMKMYSILAA